jgi:hypothetical protein
VFGLHEFQKSLAIFQRNSLVSLKIHYEPMFLLCRSTETLQSRGEFLLEAGDDFTAFLASSIHNERCLSIIQRRSGARLSNRLMREYVEYFTPDLEVIG